MNGATASAADLAEPAWLAAALLAVAPGQLRGANLRTSAGMARDAWVDTFCTLAQQETPIRVSPSVTDDVLDGGLDLSATLAAGRTVHRPGLLGSAGGRTMLLAMAERWPRHGAARIAAAMDRCESSCAFCVIGLDEGIDDDERPPEAVLDRVAFHVCSVGMPLSDRSIRRVIDQIGEARRRLPGVDVSVETIELLVDVALRFGITSSRPVQFAVHAARAHASFSGRQSVNESDVAVAAALVLAPRAMQLPSPSEEDIPRNPWDDDEPPRNEDADSNDANDIGNLPDRIVEACAAQLPKHLLDGLQGAVNGRPRGERGRKHTGKAPANHGRAIGLRKGIPKRGQRISLAATLLAAAPWQGVRSRKAQFNQTARSRRFHFRKDDLRTYRHKSSRRITTVFSVDASGSSAVHRLAEAKGAVEQLLAQSYVRRDRVALVAFRARKAEVLLPPTRSLARARRALAELPGGGATPLASGVREAHQLASAVVRSGQECHVVLLTDGRANVDSEGRGGRAAAHAEALVAARCLRADGIASIVIDISPKPGHESLELAEALGATYVPLPHGGAESISDTVQRFCRGGRMDSRRRSM